jgi:hypothetical protein
MTTASSAVREALALRLVAIAHHLSLFCRSSVHVECRVDDGKAVVSKLSNLRKFCLQRVQYFSEFPAMFRYEPGNV